MKYSLAINALLGYASAGPPEELVKSMPRMNNEEDFDYNMWSGYIPIPETTK